MNKNASDEVLKCAEETLDLLRKLKSKAEKCLEAEEQKNVNIHLEEIESILIPYVAQLEKRIQRRKQKEIEKVNNCLKSGGHFGKWTEREKLVNHWEDYQEVRVPVTYWTRVCSKCGNFEESYWKPKDLQLQEIDEQIKELQKRKENL